VTRYPKSTRTCDVIGEERERRVSGTDRTKCLTLVKTGSLELPETSSLELAETGSLELAVTSSLELAETGSLELAETSSLELAETGSLELTETDSNKKGTTATYHDLCQLFRRQASSIRTGFRISQLIVQCPDHIVPALASHFMPGRKVANCQQLMATTNHPRRMPMENACCDLSIAHEYLYHTSRKSHVQ
jgi:hypothetical protein